VLMVHVDSRAGRSSPFPDVLRTRLEALVVPPPEHASRRIGPL
jgi:acyl-CoA thioesterase FadM